MRLLNTLRSTTKAVTVVEYAILLGLISAVSIAALIYLGQTNTESFNATDTAINEAIDESGNPPSGPQGPTFPQPNLTPTSHTDRTACLRGECSCHRHAAYPL